MYIDVIISPKVLALVFYCTFSMIYSTMKWYFLSSILTAGVIALMAVYNSQEMRYILVIPAIILFYASFILFAVEYDRMMMRQWKKNEEKVKENAYVEFFQNYILEKEITKL